MMKAKHFLTGAVAVLLTVLLAFSVCSAQDVPDTEIPWENVLSDWPGGLPWVYDGPYTYDGTEHSVAFDTESTYGFFQVQGCSGNRATNAGTYTAEVTLTYENAPKDEPTRTFTKSWEITKANWDGTPAWQSGAPYVYDGDEKEVVVTGVPEGTVIEYTGNTATDAGSYTAKATLSHKNYNLPAVEDLDWEITQAEYDMSQVKWSYPGTPFTYNGKVQTVVLTGLPEGVTASYKDNTATDAGAYTATAALTYDTANYKAVSVDPCSWAIAQAEYDMSGVKWSYTGTPFVYDGQEKQVTLTGLPEGVTASYKDNTATDVGAYTATAALTYDEDNYKAISVDPCSWAIAQAEYDMSQVKWSYTGTPFVYDGQEKQVTLTGLPEGVTAAVTGGTATDAGAYTATAALTYDTANYKAVSVDPCEWAIAAAEYDMGQVKWDYPGTPFLCDGETKTVALTGLPEGVTAAYTGNTATEAGTYIASATLSVSDANYVTPSVDPLTWEITGKKQYDMSGAAWDYPDTPFVWDGTEKAVSLTGLPEGVTVSDIVTGKATEPGTYTAIAMLKWDTENYEEPSVDPLTWEIVKAGYDMSGVKWDYPGTPFTYTGKVQFVSLTGVPEGVTVSCTGDSGSEVGTYTAVASVTGWADPEHYSQPSFPEGSSTLTWSIIGSTDKKTRVDDIDTQKFKSDEKTELLDKIFANKDDDLVIDFQFSDDMLLKPSYTVIRNDMLLDPSYTVIPSDMLLKPSYTVMDKSSIDSLLTASVPEKISLKASYKYTLIQIGSGSNFEGYSLNSSYTNYENPFAVKYPDTKYAYKPTHTLTESKTYNMIRDD